MSRQNFPLVINKFKYNGFCGQSFDELANFTARAINWTNDPGIIRCACSDGQERLIPSLAIAEGKKALPPEPDYKEMKRQGIFEYFGDPSSSE